jgi:hypothetical protein
MFNLPELMAEFSMNVIKMAVSTGILFLLAVIPAKPLCLLHMSLFFWEI